MFDLKFPLLFFISRPKDQTAKAMHLSECYFYKLEVFMGNEQAVDDHLSVGVRLPNGQIQKPMSGKHLYWTKPGECALICDDTFSEKGQY